MRRLSDDNSAATSARHAAHHMQMFRKGIGKAKTVFNKVRAGSSKLSRKCLALTCAET